MASPWIAVWRQAPFHSLVPLQPRHLGSSLPREQPSTGCSLYRYISRFPGRWLLEVSPLDPTDQNRFSRSHLLPKALRDQVTPPQAHPRVTSKMLSPWFTLAATRCNNTKAHAAGVGRELAFWQLLGDPALTALLGLSQASPPGMWLLRVFLSHVSPLFQTHWLNTMTNTTSTGDAEGVLPPVGSTVLK